MAKKLSREGHRQRIRDSYASSGISGMPEHNILELLLTYAIPRKDVKELAYSLLNRFDNDLNKVFSASCDELCSVDGIGENAAILIKLFGEIPQKLAERETASEIIVDYVSEKEYVKNHFENAEKEQLSFIFISNSGKVICCETIGFDEYERAKDVLREIIKRSIKNKAASVIVVHVNPERSFEPTEDDIKAAKTVYKTLAPFKLYLKDYITVGKNGTFAMSNDIRYIYVFSGE